MENSRPSTNKLEEIPCVFFVKIIYETQKTAFLLLCFNSFSIGIMFSNSFIERFISIMSEVVVEGWFTKKNRYVSYVGEGVA